MTLRRFGVAITVVAVIAGTSGPTRAEPPGSAAVGATAPAAPGLIADGRNYRVTLLTGDVVSVTGRKDGCPSVSVTPATPSGVMKRSCGPDGHVRVTPGSVAHLIGPVLDPTLFDVTALILDGYDDARSATLPLIVRQAPGLRGADTGPLTAKRALASIDAVAGRTAKSAGPDLLRTLSNPTTRSAGRSPKVWLDRQVRATARQGQTDPNLRQVSAPRAWAAGHTGRGARVAVLDTGADFTHPDLVGRVAERADFITDGGDAVDRSGHGTHVASVVAGSGGASGGERRGVAPDAALLIGKVLDDDGSGLVSQVVAGMEWAASRADVVNLSLGSDWIPEDDVMSAAVEALTARTGALFVVAAGNSGPGDRSVGTPGVAPSALTVGAVDGTDTVAGFSSRGPVAGTQAAKPEISAPGVDIIAARAAGTTLGLPLDARYVSASGTSMATPHVAGAAALLAARHPDWSHAQLKAALVGAADVAKTTEVHTVGAGRLDAAAPLTGVVAGEPVVNLGVFAHPQQGSADTTVSWRNPGTAAVPVRLDVAVTDHNGRTQPAGSARLSTTALTVAAGATGTAVLTVDRTRTPGLYTALVTGRTTDGTVLTRTPVTFSVAAPSHELTLQIKPLVNQGADLDVSVYVTVVNLDDPAVFERLLIPQVGDSPALRVPAGRYSVMASYLGFRAGGVGTAVLVGDPDMPISADTVVSLDPARARRVGATVDGVTTEAATTGVTYLQNARRGPGWFEWTTTWGEAARAGEMFVQPMDDVSVGRFRAVASFGLRAPGTAPSPFFYNVIHPYPVGVPADPGHRVTATEKARMGRLDNRFHTVNGLPTHHAMVGFSLEDGVILSEPLREEVGVTRTDYVTPGYVWRDGIRYGDGIIMQGEARRIGPGSVESQAWAQQPLRPDWFDSPTPQNNGCTPRLPVRTRGSIGIELATVVDRHNRFDCMSGWGMEGMTRQLRLFRNGSLVGTTAQNFGDFAVPAGAGDFRLVFDVDNGPGLGAPTRSNTEWTFRSTGPKGTGYEQLPLLSVDYDLRLGPDNRPVPGQPVGSLPAEFTVRQGHGVKAQRVTAFEVWTSVDGGATWQPATVTRHGDATFRAALPLLAAGRSMSLRVSATGDGGSGITQTVIGAYAA
jgi:subtilisin family serine protease